MKIEVFAPAKINLCLHVTGQRDDGYHLIESIVTFADVGDHIRIAPGTGRVSVTGPFSAGVPQDSTNLVSRAAAFFRPEHAVDIDLVKNLPPASGIGGGSSDAAAVLRGLSRMAPPEARPADLAAIGADVPVCYAAQPCRMAGIGADLTPETVPDFDAVLVNPGVEIATPEVFSALEHKTNPALPRAPEHERDWIMWLTRQRNDLEEPAITYVPVIAHVLAAIEQTADCRLARMSGSGATCFGLFPHAEAARRAAEQIAKAHPSWWVMPARLGRQDVLPRDY